jgi:PadR family transcriptional regulator PadR
MNIQFKKGVLELCVLVVLRRRDYYGYELIQTISRNIDIAEGTIYPLLRRLMQEGYFTTYITESAEGPARRYYRITEKGKTHTKGLLGEWERFICGVNNLIREEGAA